MGLNFKIVPDRASPGSPIQLTAIDIIEGGFGRTEGTATLVAADGSEEPLRVDTWLPFGLEATLPPVVPGPGPWTVTVRTAAPLELTGSAAIEIVEEAGGAA